MDMRVFAATSEAGPEIQGKSFALWISYWDTRKWGPPKNNLYLVRLSNFKLPTNVFCAKIWDLHTDGNTAHLMKTDSKHL